MSTSGLTGKKFIGKIVKGFDPENRGRYYVHIPELQPHMAESVGILCTNSIHTTRLANGSSGGYGSYMPLHEGTTVEVICQTDDISSARIISIVSDDKPGSDMSPGQLFGVEPSGHIAQVAVKGSDDPKSPNSSINKVQEFINSGSETGLKLLGPVLNKLGNVSNQLRHLFSGIISKVPGGDKLPLDQIISQLPNVSSDTQQDLDISSISIDAFDSESAKNKFANFKKMADALPQKMEFNKLSSLTSNNSITSSTTQLTSIRDHLGNINDPIQYQSAMNTLRDIRAQQLLEKFPSKTRKSDTITYNDLSADEKTTVDISLGAQTETRYISDERSKWGQQNANNLANISLDGSQQNNKEYGKGTEKSDSSERDQQYTSFLTPKKSGMYVNENTSNDPDSLYIVYNGKITVFRMDESGVHISTDHNYRQKVTVNNDIEIDGSSSIKVNGGNYDIYVNGAVNIQSTENINLDSKKSINITATDDVSISAGKQIHLKSIDSTLLDSLATILFQSKDMFAIKSGNDILLKSDSNILSQAGDMITGKAGNSVAFDGSRISLNGGESKDIEIELESWDPIPAKPTKRPVNKV